MKLTFFEGQKSQNSSNFMWVNPTDQPNCPVDEKKGLFCRGGRIAEEETEGRLAPFSGYCHFLSK